MARRIFWVFLSCALLPCAGLILITYFQVESFFYDKSQRQLRDLAKLFGLDVHERLTLLDESSRSLLPSSTRPRIEPRQIDRRETDHTQRDRWKS